MSVHDDIGSEILKVLNEPPESAFHFKVLQDEVMIIYSAEHPQEADRNELFSHTIQKMIERKMIALENDLIRLFKNSKVNRAAQAERNNTPKRFGWQHPRRHIIGSDDEDETFSSKCMVKIAGTMVEMSQLETKVRTDQNMMFGISPPSPEDLSIPRGPVYPCNDLELFEGTVDTLYSHDCGQITYHFFVDCSGTLFVLIATDKGAHQLRSDTLLEIFQAVDECEHTPNVERVAVVFVVPYGGICNLQRLSCPSPKLTEKYPRKLQIFVRNQFRVVLPPGANEDDEEDDGEEDEFGIDTTDYWGLPPRVRQGMRGMGQQMRHMWYGDSYV